MEQTAESYGVEVTKAQVIEGLIFLDPNTKAFQEIRKVARQRGFRSARPSARFGIRIDWREFPHGFKLR